jgi:hypothetical protein
MQFHSVDVHTLVRTAPEGGIALLAYRYFYLDLG